MLPPARWDHATTTAFEQAVTHAPSGTAAALLVLREDPTLRESESVWTHVAFDAEHEQGRRRPDAFPRVQIEWAPLRAWTDAHLPSAPGSHTVAPRQATAGYTMRRVLQFAAYLAEGDAFAVGMVVVRMLSDVRLRQDGGWPLRARTIAEAMAILAVPPVAHAVVAERVGEWPWS